MSPARGSALRPAGLSSPEPVSQASGYRLAAAAVALVVAACLPLGRVFLGLGWSGSVLAATLLGIGIPWWCGRCRLPAWATLAATAAGWFAFVAIAFLSSSLRAGFLPTTATFAALADLWAHGVELLRVRPAPTPPEPGIMLLVTASVVMIASAVEVLVIRVSSPVHAVFVGLILWMTPLVISPAAGAAWPLTIPMLASAAWLLLESAPSKPRPAGWALAVTAITLGLTAGQALPGTGEGAWFRFRGIGATASSSNPIVNIKARLVGQDTTPLLRVRSPRPVYLRLTALDVYDGEREEWTTRGIRGAPITSALQPDEPLREETWITVDVTVAGLDPSSVLVPTPYRPVAVSGPASQRFRYDARAATLIMRRGARLQASDQYRIVAAVPDVTTETLRHVDVPRGGPQSALPAGIPPAVTALARQIVDSAGARTAFEQALAIQTELRSWTYSLDPPPGHGASAMVAFIRNREGYCEQFAGTMAVMLRSLGIPARVAVGYTPGAATGSGEYVVTQQNAHAWVEVFFPGFGWITFEPTPRSDGNVLVPSTAEPVPEATINGTSFTAPFVWLVPDLDLAGVGHTVIQLIFLALAVLVLVTAWRIGSEWRRTRGSAPAERVLRALASVQGLGRGLGVHPKPTETHLEYMRRLVGSHPAGTRLASLTTAADYAPRVTESDAQLAQVAAKEIETYLLNGRSVPRRAAIRIRSGILHVTRSRVRSGP